MDKKITKTEKFITIYTLISYICAIIIFEIGYCNTNWIRNIIEGNIINLKYNFSLCRIIIYIIFLILYLIFRKKFINSAIEVAKNKYKRLFIYITMAMLILSIAFAIVAIWKMDRQLIRAISIGLIMSFLGSLFVVYVSNDIIKNTIIISCTLGVVFTFTTSYNHAIDEKKHFMSAFNIAFFNLDYEKNPITDKRIEELPHLSKYTTIDSFFEKYEPNITDEVNKEDVPSTPAPYNFITYIFPAIGIFISKTLGGSIIDMYIMGRIMNLVLYTVLIAIALKILPYKKNIFFILAFMPYILLLAASYSIDGFCIGIVYIFIAYCLKIYKEDDIITLKHFIILVSLFLAVLLAKNMAYILVGFIALMLPLWKTIKNNKKYIPIMIIISIIVIVVLALLLIYIKKTKLIDDSRASGEINSNEQIYLMLTNPIHDIKLIIEHTKNTLLNFDWYVMLYPEAFFTATSRNVLIPLILYILYIALTESDYIFKIKDKIIMIISFLLVWGMTSIAMYMVYTQVGALYIAGYQARYIMPVLPLALLCIANKKVINVPSENRNMNIAICSSIFIMIGLLQLIIV